MPDGSWYEVVQSDASLTQGDLLFDCPVLAWTKARTAAGVPAPDETRLADFVGAFREDVVVMTQACDLEHGKVKNVVLCPHLPLSAFRAVWQNWMEGRKQKASEKAWKRACEDIANGYVWNQSFLAPSDHPGLAAEIRVVDFHDIFTIPRAFLESLLHTRATSRLRLLAPYREYLSQAFARFFMRVGLPQPVEIPASSPPIPQG